MAVDYPVAVFVFRNVAFVYKKIHVRSTFTAFMVQSIFICSLMLKIVSPVQLHLSKQKNYRGRLIMSLWPFAAYNTTTD